MTLQMYSYKSCEILYDIYFSEQPWATGAVNFENTRFCLVWMCGRTFHKTFTSSKSIIETLAKNSKYVLR